MVDRACDTAGWCRGGPAKSTERLRRPGPLPDIDRPGDLLSSVAAERREPLTDEDAPAVPACGGPAPLHADLEQVRPVDLVQPRLDLHLRQGDVEALADELLDPLEVVGVVADEDWGGWVVGS